MELKVVLQFCIVVTSLQFTVVHCLPTIEMDSGLDNLIRSHNVLVNESVVEFMRRREKGPIHLGTNRQIPYYISDQFDETEQSKIKYAIERFNHLTCLEFVPLKNYYGQDFVLFRKMDSCVCSCQLGRQKGRATKLSLGACCLGDQYEKAVLHEMMHAIGFYHEQRRYDRDEWVKIHYDNIDPDLEHNFDIRELSVMDNTEKDFITSTKYDYCSIMHYWATAASKPEGSITIERKYQYPKCKMGTATTFSKYDLEKIKKRYNC